MYNCAVIGLGNIGFKLGLDPKREWVSSHIDVYKKCTFTNLVGVVEIDSENIQVFKKINQDMPVYNTIQD